MLLEKRNVITGLEGCGKSSKTFQYISQFATPESPILIGVKNYQLMKEQMHNWSERFEIPLDYFAIAGRSVRERPLDFYFNVKRSEDSVFPSIIEREVRFIFTTQACIQRNLHWLFSNMDGRRYQYSHILIDEFEYTSGIIPTLDYEYAQAREGNIKSSTETQKLRWIKSNYTQEDSYLIQDSKAFHSKGFTVAHWINHCETQNCPLTFLTSEVLATQILKAIGFKEINLDSKNFLSNQVNVWASPHIGRAFFNEMNSSCSWNKLADKYDLVISDCVIPYFQDNSKSLEVSVINHMSARGSNSHKDKQILTVVSHIPLQPLTEIRDALNYFGLSMDLLEVSQLFYRDRVCQAVGRVLGYRGSDSTDLLIHEDIFLSIQTLDSFPYTLNTEWNFYFDGLDQILSQVEKEKIVQKEKRKIIKERAKKAFNPSYLNELFYCNSTCIIPVKEVKEYVVEKGYPRITAEKVAKFFGLKAESRRIGGKNVRCIIGLEIKT